MSVASDSTVEALNAVRRLARNPGERDSFTERQKRKMEAMRAGVVAASGGAVRPDARGVGPADASRGMRERKRRRMTASNAKRVTRGSSPSHYHVSPREEGTWGDDFAAELPDRRRVDRMLRAASSAFYRQRQYLPKSSSSNGEPPAALHPREYNKTEYATVDMVRSPIRKARAWDSWTPFEIALFEAGVCKHGKDFRAVASLIEGKSTADVVRFYYTAWKHSAHYRAWKASRPAEEPDAATAFLRPVARRPGDAAGK